MVDSSCHYEDFNEKEYTNAIIALMKNSDFLKLKEDDRKIKLDELKSQYKLCSKICRIKWNEKQRLNNKGNGLNMTEEEKEREIAECESTKNRQSGGKSRRKRKNKSRRFRKNKNKISRKRI